MIDKVNEIIAALKMKGERTSYDELRRMIYLKIGSDARTVKRVDDIIRTFELLDDEGNGILKIR